MKVTKENFWRVYAEYSQAMRDYDEYEGQRSESAFEIVTRTAALIHAYWRENPSEYYSFNPGLRRLDRYLRMNDYDALL